MNSLRVDTELYPCVPAALACLGGDAARTGPLVCAEASTGERRDSCALERTCEQPLAAGAGAEVVELDSSSVECEAASSAVRCTCHDGRSYELSSIAGACAALIDHCASEDELSLGDPECSITVASDASDFCDAGRECRQEVELAGGDVVVRADTEYVSCTRDSSGSASCKCGTLEGFSFWTTLSRFRAPACESLLDVCRHASAIEWSSDVTCELSSQQAEQGSCHAELACTRAGSSGEHTVYGRAPLTADCVATSAEQFRCSCNGGTSKTIELPASSAWEACTELVQRCPDEVELGL